MNIIRPNISNANATATRNKRPANIASQPAKTLVEAEDLLPPASRGFRSIPDMLVMEGLIKKALNALKVGVYWDRGSIINIEA